jgi:hypothetical protein
MMAEASGAMPICIVQYAKLKLFRGVSFVFLFLILKSGLFSCPEYGFRFVLVFCFPVSVQIKYPFKMLSMQPGF